MQTGRASRKVMDGVLKRINEVAGLDLWLDHAYGGYMVMKPSGGGAENLSARLDGGSMLQWLDGFQTCVYMGKAVKRPRHATR